MWRQRIRCAKLTGALAVMLAVVCMLSAGGWAESASGGEKKPTFIELTQQLARANQEMYGRDRTDDTPIYQIDEQNFVSEQDVQALVNVLTARRELAQSATGSPTGNAGIDALLEAIAKGLHGEAIESDEDFAKEFLIGELLLRTEAAELGIDDLDKSVMRYIKEGWLEPEPPTPNASDTEALLTQGWVRLQLMRNDLMGSTTTKSPYENSAALIAELIETLKQKYPSMV